MLRRTNNACCAVEKGRTLRARNDALVLRVEEQGLLVILERSALRKQQSVEVVGVTDSQARSDAVCSITSTCIGAGAGVGVGGVGSLIVIGYWHIIADVLA